MDSYFSLPVRGRLERRHIVLGAALLLMIGIFALRETSGQIGEGLSFLYVIPVALVALELGLRAGVATALFAFVLVIVWAESWNVSLDASEVIVRLAALVGTAAIAGRFSDRMRSGSARHEHLLDSGLALAESTDRAGLPALVARCAVEIVPARGARVRIEPLPAATTGSLEGEIVVIAIRAGDAECGVLEAAPPAGRHFSADEEIALELLAVQAAVAAEHHRLTALQVDQAALHAELSEAHGQLAEQGRRLELLLNTHETERRTIAHELHDQAAQALAAIQLGLTAVERDLGSEPTRAQVETLRSRLADTLRTLRELAVELRPPALDQLGLDPALRGLAERAHARAGHEITIATEGLNDRLAPHLETTVYRVVDDLVASDDAPTLIRVEFDPRAGVVRIVATPRDDSTESLPAPEILARIRARLELIDGLLTVLADQRALIAEIRIADDHADCVDAGPPATAEASSSASR